MLADSADSLAAEAMARDIVGSAPQSAYATDYGYPAARAPAAIVYASETNPTVMNAADLASVCFAGGAGAGAGASAEAQSRGVEYAFPHQNTALSHQLPQSSASAQQQQQANQQQQQQQRQSLWDRLSMPWPRRDTSRGHPPGASLLANEAVCDGPSRINPADINRRVAPGTSDVDVDVDVNAPLLVASSRIAPVSLSRPRSANARFKIALACRPPHAEEGRPDAVDRFGRRTNIATLGSDKWTAQGPLANGLSSSAAGTASRASAHSSRGGSNAYALRAHRLANSRGGSSSHEDVGLDTRRSARGLGLAGKTSGRGPAETFLNERVQSHKNNPHFDIFRS